MSVKVIKSGLNNSLSGESVQEKQSGSSMQEHNKKASKGKGTIYAGNLNLGQDEITMNRIKNQKKAMKTILDQYQKDKNIGGNITKIKDHKEELGAELKYASEQYQSLTKLRQELKEANGFTDESEEEADLALLEKSIYSNEPLTEEEQQRLKDMGPLTLYQKTALQYDSMAKLWKNRIDNINTGISNDTRSITSIQIELLKTHPMVDAQKEALKILEAASKETIGMIVDEAKDQLEKEQQKQIEDARDKEKERQEEEEKLRKLKEEKEKKKEGVTEEGSAPKVMSIDTVTVEVADIKAVQQEVLSELMLAARKNMLEEDTKGIAVDEFI